MKKKKDINMILENSGSIMKIIDDRLNVHFASRYAPAYSDNAILQALEEAKEISSNIYLKSKKINGGYVLWTENISEIGDLVDEEMRKEKSLTEDNIMLEAELNMKLKEARVDVGQYLYKKMVVEVKENIENIQKNIRVFGQSKEKKRDMLIRLCCQCVYIKRKMNLMFIMEECDKLEVEDLYHSIREYVQYLSLLGQKCSIAAEFLLEKEKNMDTFKYEGDCILNAYEHFDIFCEENTGRGMNFLLKIYDSSFALWCGEVLIYEADRLQEKSNKREAD